MDKPPNYDDVIEEARDRFETGMQDDSDNRDNYRSDLDFVYTPGRQWSSEVKSTRKGWGEDCLEFNQLKPFVAQVVNDQLQNRPGCKVHPQGMEASEEVAEIVQGLIRSIENESGADSVYKNAFRLAVAGNRGWWRICSEYESGDGFSQRLCIKPIQDSNAVLADLDYEQPDGSDRKWVFVFEKLKKTEFLRRYPDAPEISWDGLDGGWGDSDEIVIADYYRRVCTKRKMVLMSDGAKGDKEELLKATGGEFPPGVMIVKEREIEEWTVEWYTLAGGQQVIAKHEWPGTIIPVVCTPGEDIIVDGKRVYQSLTRHARDAQSMLNYGMTQQATHLALTPKAPWVIAEGQIQGYESMWKDANKKAFSALVYKPTTVDGVVVPPPQRTMPAMASDGWERWTQTMLGMIKSTIGIYENTLGQRGQEVSGKAIIAREKQGDTATFNFVHNWYNAIELTGWILVELIPHYYDDERIITIIQPDDTKKQVKINQTGVFPMGEALSAIRHNDLKKGKYGITLETGPSYATKRQETSEQLLSLVETFPPLAQVAGDLIVKSLNIADADIIAERYKLTLPEIIQKAEAAKAEGKPPPDPELLAVMNQKDMQLQQAGEQLQELTQRNQELESGHELKMRQLVAEAQLKERASDMEVNATSRKAQVEADLTIQKAQIDAAAKIKVAEIDQETKLAIAAMAKPEEPEAKIDEDGNETQKVDPLMMLAETIATTQGATAEAINNLAQAMSKPKTIVRGSDGRAVGVQ